MRRGKAHSDKSKERIRSFVAVDLEASVVTGLRELQRELSRIDADVRWVRPEGIHVTLKFLGDVDAQLLPRLQEELVAALQNQEVLNLRVHGLGGFPSLRRPRVLWVGMAGRGLAELAQLVDAAVAPLGFAPERRPFTGHVTLGRVNSLRGWAALEELMKAEVDRDFGTSEVREIILYRSELQPGGSVYTALWTIPLNQNKGTP